MTLIELLLTQREILLTSLLAFVPLLAAMFVLLLPHLRRWGKAAARRRKARKAERAALAAMLSAAAAQATPPEEVAEEDANAPDAQGETAQRPVPVQPAAEASAAAGPASEGESADGEETSSAIQEILDSVFEDEEANERYETLLRDISPVMATELALRCDAIAGQLRRYGPRPLGR